MANELMMLQMQQQIAMLQAQLAAVSGGQPQIDTLLAQRTALEKEVSDLYNQVKGYEARSPRMMEIAKLIEQRAALQATLSALESIQVG